MTGSTVSEEYLLVITRNLPPLIGGMERLLLNAVLELRQRFEVAVVGPAGCEKILPGSNLIVGITPYPLWRFLLASLGRSLFLARRLRPRVVLAGSGLTAPIALVTARLSGAIAVAQLHGLDLVARNPAYRLFFVATFRWLDAVIVNSRNTACLAADNLVHPDRIHVIHPGVTFPDAQKRFDDSAFLTRHGLQDKQILLSVGRLTARKGNSAFIRQCMPDIVRAHPNTMLVIAGDTPRNALKRDNDEIQEIRRAIDDTDMNGHVRLLGAVSDDDLDLCYRNSSVFVFPAIPVAGDVEGFGIVALEAASRGIPTVAFSEGGIVDAVDDGLSGYLVTSGAYSCFAQKVNALLDNPDLITPNSCEQHAKKFDATKFGGHLRAVFDTIIASYAPKRG